MSQGSPRFDLIREAGTDNSLVKLPASIHDVQLSIPPMPDVAGQGALRDLTNVLGYSLLRGLLKIYLKACIETTSVTSSVLRAGVVTSGSITSAGR
jgi:hypothetical protein